jgi:hypothetical protein
MTLGEQRRKALELLAPPPSRHDHSDGGIRASRGSASSKPFMLGVESSVEPIRPIECQRRDAIRNLLDKLLFLGCSSLEPISNRDADELSRAVAVLAWWGRE